MNKRKEMILLAVGLLILAALFLYRMFVLPDEYLHSAPQTAVQTTEADGSFAHSRYAVNINEASYEELMGVRGMTDTIARGILAYRAETGRFYSADELLNVPGVGKKTLEKLRPYIRTDNDD